MKFYVINLKKDLYKKKIMENLLLEREFKFEFIDAIDGKECINNLKYEIKPFKRFGRDLTPGEVGTVYSHQKALRAFLQKEESYAVILEDDIEMDSKIQEVLDIVSIKAPGNLDVLLLGHHECWTREEAVKKNFWYSFRLNGVFTLYKPSRLSMGAYGYMVSRKGAKKLLELSKSPNRPFDWYTGDSRIQNLYILEEPVILIKKELEKASNLSKERLIFENKVKLGEPNTLLRKIRRKLKYKLWPIIKVLKNIKIKLDPFLIIRSYK